MEKQGDIAFPYQVQPGWQVTERLDGTIEGTVDFVTKPEWADTLPEIGDPHPGDDRLEVHTLARSFDPLQRVRLTAHYLGLTEDPTDPVLSCVGSPDREAIETHPDFVSVLAGVPSAPKNDAHFVSVHDRRQTVIDKDYLFSHFETNAAATESLAGIQYYLKASTQVELTWWQTKVPVVQRMVIVNDIKPFKKPDGVKDFLSVDTPYRQVGNHYQVTQIALGSGPGGWSQLLYPQDDSGSSGGLQFAPL